MGEANRAKAAALQDGDPHSLLALTRQVLAIRRGNAALRQGRVAACVADGDRLVIIRESDGRQVECRFNLGTGTLAFDDAPGGEMLLIPCRR